MRVEEENCLSIFDIRAAGHTVVLDCAVAGYLLREDVEGSLVCNGRYFTMYTTDIRLNAGEYVSLGFAPDFQVAVLSRGRDIYALCEGYVAKSQVHVQ